jgi:hypothetical protein
MAGYFSCSHPPVQNFEQLACPQCKSSAKNWYQELRQNTKYQVKSSDDFWEQARVNPPSSGIPIGRAYWRDMFSIDERQAGAVEWLFVTSDSREMSCMRALHMFAKRLNRYDPFTRSSCDLYSTGKVMDILTGMALLANVLIPKETTFCCSSCLKAKGVRQRYVHMKMPLPVQHTAHQDGKLLSIQTKFIPRYFDQE